MGDGSSPRLSPHFNPMMKPSDSQVLELVVNDVKMQMLMLQKKLDFLNENGGMTAEIDQKEPTNSLLAKCPPKRLLVKVKPMKAERSYTGANLEDLLVRSGDLIHVYAYIDEENAIGFNTRTNLGGQFPLNIVSEVGPEAHIDPEVLVCKSSI